MKLSPRQERWRLRIAFVVCIPIILIGALILGLGKLLSAIGWLMMFEPKQSIKEIKLP